LRESGEPQGHRAIVGGLALGLVGLALFGFGLLLNPRQAYLSYLTAYATGLSLVLGVLILVMIAHLTGAAWFGPLREAANAVIATLPIFAVLFVPVVLGMHLLYPWVPPHPALSAATRESIAAKQHWLNVPFFLFRAALYFSVWIGVALMLRHFEEDRRRRALSAAALPAVGLSFTFAAFDWMMSLSPDWSSTIYGVYVFAGGFLAALALLAAAAPSAARGGLLVNAPPTESYHALGKLLLTFVIFWLYIGFSQLLIIWIADVPSEVTWYLSRLHGSWAGVAALLLAGNFLAPFLLLLFRRIKRAPAVLATIGAWLLGMHYLDVYWLVMPELHSVSVQVHWLDLATLSAVSGTPLAYGAWQLRRHARLSGSTAS
jgi:hypothetical protein